MGSSTDIQLEHAAAAQTGARADSVANYQQALSLWLEWNRAYETVTAQMFASRDDVALMREAMDRMDQIRRQAVELSRSLVPPLASD